MRRAMIDRFLEKVKKLPGDDACWEWTASRSGHGRGYGQLLGDGEAGEKRQQRAAHRISWELHFGPIPAGQCVLHRCDNRKCVRPDHLFLGTRLDNARDRDAKDRVAHGRGHYKAKLTESEVTRIRRRHWIDGESTWAISKDLSLAQGALWRLINGKAWRRVPFESDVLEAMGRRRVAHA